jgi:hypothetical protein
MTTNKNEPFIGAAFIGLTYVAFLAMVSVWLFWPEPSEVQTAQQSSIACLNGKVPRCIDDPSPARRYALVTCMDLEARNMLQSTFAACIDEQASRAK